jgi:hypothetical protein
MRILSLDQFQNLINKLVEVQNAPLKSWLTQCQFNVAVDTRNNFELCWIVACPSLEIAEAVSSLQWDVKGDCLLREVNIYKILILPIPGDRLVISPEVKAFSSRRL